jgi:uncharacterized integral membrane protein
MQTVGMIVFLLSVLVVLISAANTAPAILSFRPFDYHKVGYRSGLLFTTGIVLMVLGLSLYEGVLSHFRASAVLEVLGSMLVGALFALLISYVCYRFLRSFFSNLRQAGSHSR